MTTQEQCLNALTSQWINRKLARREISQATANNYRTNVSGFLRSVGDGVNVADVTAEHIERWLTAPKPDGTVYKAQTMNTRRIPIDGFFGWAHQEGIIATNPTDGIGRAKVGLRFPKFLKPADVDRLLWMADGRDRAIILTGLQLGLRRAEIAAMRLEHWDRDNGTLYVVGKGDKERSLPVQGEICEALTRWVDVGLKGARVGPMWPSTVTAGQELTPGRVGDIVGTVAERAGVDATTHRLRHTCGHDMAAAGVPMPIIQVWLGHASVATTTIYVVPGRDELGGWACARQYLTPRAEAA